MPFTLPSFNLAYNCWHTGVVNPVPPPVGGPAFTALCNFSLGRRIATGTDSFSPTNVLSGDGIDVMLRIMMVPAGVDLRGPYQGESDLVEVPAGSGAFYALLDVADMAKGFPNEHRVAWAIPTNRGFGYFLPTPLP